MPVQLPFVVASFSRKLAVAVGVDVVASRNKPLRTALAPACRVIVISRFPETFQSRYTPPENDEMVWVSSTVPLTASLSCTCSPRPLLSQSSKYSSRSCAWPSARLTSTVKLVAEYQTAATRFDEPGTCRARGSEEVFVQV